jgi:hypothetical protein
MQKTQMDIGQMSGDITDVLNRIDGAGRIIDGDHYPFPVTHGIPPCGQRDRGA